MMSQTYNYNSVCAADNPSTLVLSDMPVREDVIAGMPVYWDIENQYFAPACAKVMQDCNTGEYTPSPEADCIGIVSVKKTKTRADIVMFGIVDLPAIRNYLGSGEGRFFLSTEEGFCSFLPSSVCVPVGVVLGSSDPCDTRVLVYVHPEYAGKPFQHTHYSFTLQDSLWKDVTEFTNVPANAVKGYDWREDEGLKVCFPPIPVEACACTIDWDGKNESGTVLQETFGGREVPVGTYIQVDSKGIWWLKQDISPGKTEESPDFRITIHFSRIRYGNNEIYVTRLQPDANQPLAFVDCNGNAASTGDLYAQFTLGNKVIESSNLTGKAIKQFNEQWEQENVPVIHGIRSLNNNLRLSGDTFSYEGSTYYHKLLSVETSAYSEDYELHPQVVKLAEALESEYNRITYIALPYSRPASLTMKMEVPGVFGSNLRLKLRLTCLAKLSGTYPQLDLQYIRIPRPVNQAIDLTTRFSPRDVTLQSTVAVTSDTVFELESEEIDVSEGDTLVWILKRENADGYIADAGFIRMAGILNIGENA
ncbi:MAG: hypothetical protein Q4D38_00230 [Planctomycetia bacterium]|nr:hypothetical protein [Planctomycetia bacterium]